MKIPETLKENLITDAEVVFGKDLNEQQKVRLGRLFEMTIGNQIRGLNIEKKVIYERWLKNIKTQRSGT